MKRNTKKGFGSGNSYLVLEEHDAGSLRARHMIDVLAAGLETPDRGARIAARGTAQRQASLTRGVYVDEGAVHCLVDLIRPQRTVEVHPLVYAQHEQSETTNRAPWDLTTFNTTDIADPRSLRRTFDINHVL